MNEKDVIENVGRCGKICTFCKDAAFCRGCGSTSAECAKHLTREGCYQYHCSKQKGLAGCWECDDAPCDMDVFSKDNNIRYRAFVRFAKYEGVEELGKCVFQNMIHGIRYGEGKAYDQFDSEEKVVQLLTKHYLSDD